MTGRSTDVSLPKEFEKKLTDYISRYPSKKSAVMPGLYLAQQHYGYLPDDAYLWVANRLEISTAHVREVATFYTMYYKSEVGKYHFQVCRTLSCMLCGARKLTAKLKERFEIEAHEVSKDGMWSFEEVECLGSCGTAPMIQINDVFFECLTPEELDKVIDRIEKEKPELRFDNLAEAIQSGMSDCPRSRAWMSGTGS